MIVALAGRRIDADNAEAERFPQRMHLEVQSRIAGMFREAEPAQLLGSAACGADLLALEVAGKQGVIRNVVLPFSIEVFRKKSVVDRGQNWGEIFDQMINDVNNENHTKGFPAITIKNFDGDDAYEQTNVAILDLADAIALESGSIEKVALIVWNGKPRGGGDITGHFKRMAFERGYSIQEINTLI